jgi:hypothetical protein
VLGAFSVAPNLAFLAIFSATDFNFDFTASWFGSAQ